MSDIWAPVIAALGSSILTGLVAFGLEWWRSRRSDKSSLADRRSRAYSMLLTRSTSVMQLATNLHILMELRSGLKEGINVTIGKQKALDPSELVDRLSAETQPLYEAWSEIWVVGSKEAIAEANDLLARCGTVVGVATQRGDARPLWWRAIAGEKWTQAQLDQWQEELRGLAESRRKLGVIARKETGVEIADLFASNDLKQINHH
jgi:hypothetical protein